ncbi:MAG: slipin family protein, partial [bacterium]
MFIIKRVKVHSYEKGLYFRDGEFKGLLDEGRHWFCDPLFKVKVYVVSQRNPWLEHEDLDLIVKSGALKDQAAVLDIKDHQRALVWVEGRFEKVVGPGLYALWKDVCDVKVEMVDASDGRLCHQNLNIIAKSKDVDNELNSTTVEQGHAGVLFKDGIHAETLGPGQYLFWKNIAKIKFYHVDMRETVLDISGQEIITAD